MTVSRREIITVHFQNRLQQFRVWGEKRDSKDTAAKVSSVPQGDASLVGAVYGLYHNGELMEQMTTDKQGYFFSQCYTCSYDEWYVQEISPSPGYLLDPTKYFVNSEPGEEQLDFNNKEITCFEQVKQGKVSIVKHLDEPDPDGNGSDQIEKPEANAQFQVYLTSSGSYDSANDWERDLIVTDENGCAITKDLPYEGLCNYSGSFMV